MKFIFHLRFAFLLLIFSAAFVNSWAQYEAPLYTSYTTSKARAAMVQRIHANTITGNLQLPLSDSTEENWMDAFDAMEVFKVNTSFTFQKLQQAFDSVQSRSIPFQKKLMEVAYANFPGKFHAPVSNLIQQTADSKVFALCAEYLIQHGQSNNLQNIDSLLRAKFGDSLVYNPVLFMLLSRLHPPKHQFNSEEVFKQLFSNYFLPGEVVMYSVQRKNRDYPGLVLLRDAAGNFVKDSDGQFFNIPQLARSISNLPSYLTNGNTPQGIFRMYGFKISMSSFIGPTANVQMGMPVELSKQKYFNDSSISDSVWRVEDYQRLLGHSLSAYAPLYNAWYAGMAGRTEIIAHGTTLDPELYKGMHYYPLTPTQGCLCTREIWNGKRLQSDQQKLVNGLLKAGGADGYCVVVEIDDKETPVKIEDLLPYLKDH